MATAKQRKFARELAVTGSSQKAAKAAGYHLGRSAGARESQLPYMAELVRRERERFVDIELAGLGYACLVDLLTNPDRTPPSVRFAAAKFALELGGHKATRPPGGDDGKALADMTLTELAAFIKRGDETIAAMRSGALATPELADNAQVIEGEALQVADLLA